MLAGIYTYFSGHNHIFIQNYVCRISINAPMFFGALLLKMKANNIPLLNFVEHKWNNKLSKYDVFPSYSLLYRCNLGQRSNQTAF